MEIDFNPFPHRSTFVDLTGKRYGRWTVLKETPNPKPGRQSRWHCRCDCGKEKPAVLYGSLVGRRSESCGCLRMEGLIKPTHQVHGQRNPTYRSWRNMRTRCYNSRHPSYRQYGLRGITVCPQWQDDFDQFFKDMGPRPEGLTLERENNEGHYTPGNCKWGTRCEQAGNTRRNLVVEWNTVQCNLIDVARMENVDYASLRYHVFHKGRPLQTAISILRAQGQVFYERATEKGSTRKNKTDEKRTKREPRPLFVPVHQ
jgi:hypothetical protein